MLIVRVATYVALAIRFHILNMITFYHLLYLISKLYVFRAINSCMSPSSLAEESVVSVGASGLDSVSLSSNVVEPMTPVDLNDTEVEKRHFLGGKSNPFLTLLLTV